MLQQSPWKEMETVWLGSGLLLTFYLPMRRSNSQLSERTVIPMPTLNNLLRKVLLSLIVNVITLSTLYVEYFMPISIKPSSIAYWTFIIAFLSVLGAFFLISRHNRMFIIFTLLAFLIWLGYVVYGIFFFHPPLSM
jgi:hypothetical protein